MSFEQAAMVEAAAVELQSINIVSLRTGDSCVLTGAGKIGRPVIATITMLGWRDKDYFDSDALVYWGYRRGLRSVA